MGNKVQKCTKLSLQNEKLQHNESLLKEQIQQIELTNEKNEKIILENEILRKQKTEYHQYLEKNEQKFEKESRRLYEEIQNLQEENEQNKKLFCEMEEKTKQISKLKESNDAIFFENIRLNTENEDLREDIQKLRVEFAKLKFGKK